MKRRNVQLGFIGEGVAADERDPIEQSITGDEAIDIEIKGGKLLIVVPSGTPDEQIFERASRLGGELLLEDGRRLSFEIEDGAVGAQFNTDEPGKHEEPHVGLSSIPDIPGGV